MDEEEVKDAEIVGEKKQDQPTSASKMRQIIIETDGNSIKLVKTEVAGSIELVGILQNLIEYVKKGK